MSPFSPTLHVVDLWTTIFTGVFSKHWNWWISVSAHFSGKNENSLEAQYFTCHAKLFKYFRKLLKLRCYEACETKTVLTMHCKLKHQLPPSSILKYVHSICTSVFKVKQICLAPQTKNILIYLYLIFMMSPHIAKLLLCKINKLSRTVHEKFRPIVHEKNV